MSKRRTLYDCTLDNLKNKKLVVFGLIALAVLGSILTLAEKLTDMAAGLRRDPTVPLIEYSQVVLAPNQPWEPIARDAPNYFLERERTRAGDDPAEPGTRIVHRPG